MPEGFNPYAAPRADLDPVPAQSKRIGWKIYAWTLAVVLSGSLVFTVPAIRIADVFDYAVSVVGVVGLFGFAYRRPLLRRQVWALWSLLLPVWDVAMGVWVYPRSPGTSGRVGYFVVLIAFIPEYLA